MYPTLQDAVLHWDKLRYPFIPFSIECKYSDWSLVKLVFYKYSTFSLYNLVQYTLHMIVFPLVPSREAYIFLFAIRCYVLCHITYMLFFYVLYLHVIIHLYTNKILGIEKNSPTRFANVIGLLQKWCSIGIREDWGKFAPHLETVMCKLYSVEDAINKEYTSMFMHAKHQNNRETVILWSVKCIRWYTNTGITISRWLQKVWKKMYLQFSCNAN